MTTDINHQIRQYFDSIYPQAQKDAERGAELYIESLQLEELDPEQQVLKLHEEIQRLEQESLSLEGREYRHFISTDTFKYQIFYGRWLFYGINDEVKLREGLLFTEKMARLEYLLKHKKEKLPTIRLSDFLTGNIKESILELSKYSNEESWIEYHHIINWQTEKMVECVALESSSFIERFIVVVGDCPQSMDLIKAEILQIENLFYNAPRITTSQFIEEVLKLKGLSSTYLPENEQEFHASFCNSLENDKKQNSFTASFLLTALEKINNHQLSDAPICYWSLKKYKKRLTHVIETGMFMHGDFEETYDSLFLSTLLNEYYQEEMYIPTNIANNPPGSIPEEQFLSILNKEKDHCYYIFNRLKYPEYYYLLLELPDLESYQFKQDPYEHPYFQMFCMEIACIKNYFVNHCFQSLNLNELLEELKETINLYKYMNFLEKDVYAILAGTFEQDSIDIIIENPSVDIIASMVPSIYILDDMMKTIDVALQQAYKGVHRHFVFKYLDILMDKLWDCAAYNLEYLFKTQPADKKRSFITAQIREMKYEMIQAEKDGRNLPPYFNDLKQLLYIEMQYIQSQPNHGFYEINHQLQELPMNGFAPSHKTINTKPAKDKKPVSSKLLAFCYDLKKTNHLSLVFDELSNLNAFGPEVTLRQFCRLFNGKEVSQPVRWMARLIDLKAFIDVAKDWEMLDYPYQQHWNIAVKCFVKEDGSSFNVTSLKSAKSIYSSNKFSNAALKLPIEIKKTSIKNS